MSGRFGSLGGIIEIMFNSRRGNSCMPGGGCCNNNFGNYFGNIWGSNCGAMMPFANTYNPFGFNNMDSMFMPQLGGYNPYCGSQFGGYGEFDNSGSQFGAYAQFGGSDYGCHHENNGFGKLLGLLGVGLLGYGVGHSEGKTFGDKFNNFINTLLGNKTKKDSAAKPAEPEPKINIDSDKVKDANSNANAGTDPTKNTQTKAETGTEKTKKADNNTKPGEAGQSTPQTEIKKANAETEEEKKLKADAQLKAKTLILTDREKTQDQIKKHAKVPMTAYDKFNITNKKAYEALDTVTTIENNDGSSITYFDEDGEKKTGLNAEGWDRIVRLAADGSGTIEAKGLDINEKENSTITKKYDAAKNLLEETVKYNKTGIIEIYSEPNKNNGFNKKTVTNPDGKKEVYVLNKNENAWIKQ